MRKLLIVPLASIMLLYSSYGFSHGESKPGPHKGHIRMPGAFHIELLIQKNKVVIYLLDIAFKNPTTKNSAVKVMLNTPSTMERLSCKASVDKFVCDLSKDKSLKSGKLLVDAVRDNVKAATASYELPLKF